MFEVGDSVLLGDEDYSFDNPVMTVVGTNCGDITCGWFDERKRYRSAMFPHRALVKLNVEEENEEEVEEEGA